MVLDPDPEAVGYGTVSRLGLRTIRITVTAVQFTGQYGAKYLCDGTVREYSMGIRLFCTGYS